MDNLKRHIREINKDFTSLFFAMYMKGFWQVEVGYKTLPLWYVTMRKELADWQLANDCCSLCVDAHRPQNTVIKSYAVLNAITNPCSPYVPLSCIGNYVDCFPNKGCGTGTTPACPYVPIGDYNGDFNTDYFK